MVFRSCGRRIGISADFRSSPSETRFRSAPRAPMTTLTTRRFASRAALDAALEQRLRQAIGASEAPRSEEHTSELQSPYDLVCRLLLEKKKKHQATAN